jgi:hypothetical protein
LPGPHSSVTFLHWQPWEIEIQWVKDAQVNVVHQKKLSTATDETYSA